VNSASDNFQRVGHLQTSLTVGESLGATAARVLLRDLIDYAGLFPPASLGMASTVGNYDSYLRSEWNWILGRLIVPVARLEEFEEAFAGLTSPAHDADFANWRLSVLLGSDVVADVARISEFNARDVAVIESVEVKIAGAGEIRQFSEVIPSMLTTYFEVPLSSLGECIAAIADCGQRAKIRTGGETAEKFPAPESVIEFVRLCSAAGVAFKATAGLHHPLRSVHRFTYQPESPSGMMHGFLNLFLAAAFLRAGMDARLAVQLLEEQSTSAFDIDSDGVGWREHRLSRSEIAAARQGLAISFGSCSFTEPVDDLRVLHLV
jgi:hypothetical protein